MTLRQNWAKNLTYSSKHVHYPTSTSEVQAIVANASKLKALGSCHSFSDIADTDADHLSLSMMNQVLLLDQKAQTVTVEAGIKYGDLATYLNAEGFALRNLASLPHISVGGACATGTHGSGEGNGCLATSVIGLEMVTADGEAKTITKAEHGDFFNALVVGLGALGVVTQLTLEVVPTFEIAQFVYLNLPLSQLFAHFNEIQASGYSVSLFHSWREDNIDQVWLKRLDTNAPSDLFGARASSVNLHPIAEIDAINCTPQLGQLGPWHERLPHFKMDFNPSSSEELQTEYMVPRVLACDAIRALLPLSREIAALLQITEIRTISADDLWLSPCYGRDSVAIHFTWQKNWPAVQALLPKIEAVLARYEARPHWGKLNSIDPKVIRSLYPKWNDFNSLTQKLDPTGKFQNNYLERLST